MPTQLPPIVYENENENPNTRGWRKPGQPMEIPPIRPEPSVQPGDYAAGGDPSDVADATNTLPPMAGDMAGAGASGGNPFMAMSLAELTKLADEFISQKQGQQETQPQGGYSGPTGGGMAAQVDGGDPSQIAAVNAIAARNAQSRAERGRPVVSQAPSGRIASEQPMQPMQSGGDMGAFVAQAAMANQRQADEAMKANWDRRGQMREADDMQRREKRRRLAMLLNGGMV